ncbi:glycoside hydrolase family 37 [soil metagenome]
MTAHARRMAALASEYLDLDRAPLTMPRSRILVLGRDEGVRVHTSEYERSLDQCRVIDKLVVRYPHGRPLPITRVLPHRIEFDGGVVSLGFAGTRSLTVGLGDGDGAPSVVIESELPDGRPRLDTLSRTAPALRIDIGPDRIAKFRASNRHREDLADAGKVWDDWFARCPIVRADLQPMTALCWWVLGANIVELPGLGDARAVVPSKIGYVGLWQWDAYFIAVGLRHGDPALAREQLDLAFRFPTGAGQLPDVVHERGTLASSVDLPDSDRATLRRAGSAVADPDSAVPLTKPPLAAWALRKVLEVEDADEWARVQLATIRRSQDWWFAGSDLDGDGMPEYGHPYSSGLDDSPIFDGPIPTVSPDLGAYLVLQDMEIAALTERLGSGSVAPFRARAERTFALLLDLWDPVDRRFHARGAEVVIASDTVVGLVPLLTGRLPDEMAGALVDAIDDPTRFAAPWSIPTVALSDPDFSPERMWRGPVWVNTNVLVIEGLRASGYPERARQLAEQTVALVIHAGGPHEYFNPLTGEKAASATTSFGWSAALFIELAVGLSQGE